MRWVTRFIPAVAALLVLVVGSMVIVSHAQSSDLNSSLGSSSGGGGTPVLVTKDNFVNDANQICLNMASQLTASSQQFTQQIKAVSQGVAANQNQAATTPLFGTTTTEPTASGSSSALGGGAGSTTTAAPAPSGSYDKSEVQQNPLAVVNQLLNEYMDQLDAVVGMQNDLLDELENLSEPPLDQPLLQQTWVSMTEAMVAQNQADVVLENILSDYYTAGFMVVTGKEPDLATAQQSTFLADALDQDLVELEGMTSQGNVQQFPGNPQPGTLEANLQAISGPVNTALGAYGLNDCEFAGIQFQNYQKLSAEIPYIANDYLVAYDSQSNSNQAISLANVLNSLPAPLGVNLVGNGAGSTPAAATG